MGMGGGGSGGAITAHVHSASAGQGGSLTDASLMNSALITENFNRLVAIAEHIATTTEAGHTFDFSADPLDMVSEFKAVLILISGRTTASFELQLKVNGTTTTYTIDGTQTDTTVVSGIARNSQAHWAILETALLDSGGRRFMGHVMIQLEDAGDDLCMVGQMGALGEGLYNFAGVQLTDTTEINEIILETSTSTWDAGTRITVYGIKELDAT